MDAETIAALNALTAQLAVVLSSMQATFNFLLGALTGCAFVAAVTREFI
jgi:hypothetical protein